MRQNKKNIKKDWLLSASEGLTGLKAPDEQPFEKFKELKFFIQQMASSGMVAHGSGWTSFLYELNEVCKLASTPVLGADIKRCSDCIHLQVDNSLDQTGPGIWCGKGHFDGIGSKEECDDLSKQNDCADFSRKQPYRSPVLPEVKEGEIPEEIRNLASELARIFDPCDRQGSIRACFGAGAIGMYRHLQPTYKKSIELLSDSLASLRREYLDARYELDRYRAALEEYAATEMNEIAKRALNNS
jgi:hypothetical protein